MNEKIKWGLLLGLLIGLLPMDLTGQEVLARLDLGKRSPKPSFYEYSPADGGLVTLGPVSLHSSRYYGITKYDADLKKEWTNKTIEQNVRKTIDFMTVIGEYILVFVSESFPKEGLIKSFYSTYDLEGNVIDEDALLSVYPNEKEQKVGLRFVLSPNKRRLLCFKSPQNRRESEELLYYIFDDEGDYVRNGEINLKYPANRFRVESLRISNAGNIFVLGKFYRNTRVNAPDDFDFMVFRHDMETESISEFSINLGTRFISELAFRLDREENLYVAGYYSNRSADRIAGTLFQKISPSGQILLNSTTAFDADFLNYFMTRNQVRKGSELRNVHMDAADGIVLRSDGGVLLIAEKFYITYQSYQDLYGHWVDREFYHYEEVILTSVDRTGNIEWNAIVDKNQVSTNPASLSYFNAISPSGNYIFYEYAPRQQGMNIYYNTVAIDGQVSERKPLFPDYRYGNAFFPRYCEQINNQEAIMVYLQNRGKTLSVVRVRME